MNRVRLFGPGALFGLVLSLTWAKVGFGQTHYDHWPLLPNIKLRFEGTDLAFQDTINWPGVDQCNHVLSYADPHGKLVAYGFGGLVVNGRGDTIHEIPEERGCFSFSSIVLLPLIADPEIADTVGFGFVYPTRSDFGAWVVKFKFFGILNGSIDTNARRTEGLTLSQDLTGGQVLAMRHANGRDWWLLVFEPVVPSITPHIDRRWLRYIITPDTITFDGVAAVIDSIRGGGEVTMNRAGDRMAMTMGDDIRTFDFDRCTGTLSNMTIVSEGYVDITACSFSPDGSKLYAANRKRSLYVFDLEAPGYPMDTVFQGAGIFGYETMNLELGPDDRLYWGFEVHTGLGAVDPTRVYLNGFRNRTYAFPNFPNYELGALEGSPCDTLSGSGTSALGAPSPEGPWSVTPTVSATGYTIRGPRPLRWEAWTLAGLLRVGDGRRESRLKVLRAAP
jgi:hypothetical protein